MQTQKPFPPQHAMIVMLFHLETHQTFYFGNCKKVHPFEDFFSNLSILHPQLDCQCTDSRFLFHTQVVHKEEKHCAFCECCFSINE